jgi:mercuric ion transport protein
MTVDPTSRPPLNAALLTVGGIGAAFADASCCGLPFLLASTGIGFAWLTGLAIFSAPYRPLLLVAAAVCLLGGAALLWRQQKVARACGVGTKPLARNAIIAGLAVGVVLFYLGYTYA